MFFCLCGTVPAIREKDGRYGNTAGIKTTHWLPGSGAENPNSKLSENNERSIMERKINETAAITVYPNGYALYEADGSATVFPVHPCGDYCYGFPPYVCTVSARLLKRGMVYPFDIGRGGPSVPESGNKGTEPYRILPFVAEDWQELADAEDSVFDCVIQREMIRNVLGCLTGRQRRVMEAYAVEGKP